MTPSEAIEAVHRLEDPRPKKYNANDPQPEYPDPNTSCPEYINNHRNSNFIGFIKAKVGYAAVGLCLDCVRSGGEHATHREAV
jgi:hypothetical protein